MSELLKNSRKARSIYVLVALGLIAVALVISSRDCQKYYLPDPEAPRFYEKSAEGRFFCSGN